jgi:hypothetical protein
MAACFVSKQGCPIAWVCREEEKSSSFRAASVHHPKSIGLSLVQGCISFMRNKLHILSDYLKLWHNQSG